MFIDRGECIVKNFKKDTISLISSVLFLIVGILLFSNPGGVIKFVSYIIGSIFIIMGIGKIISYYKMIKKMNITNTGDMVMGIISIILGIIIILCLSALAFVINIVVGAWILYSGIIKLIYAFNLKEMKLSSWVYVLIVSIILIIGGLYVVINCNTVYSTIGLFLIIYSVIEIIQYIILPKNINPNIIK